MKKQAVRPAPAHVTSLADFEPAMKKAWGALARPLNLKEIRLAAGDIKTLNIGGPNGGSNEIKLDAQVALDEGFDGLRVIAHENGTTVRCTSHDGIALKIGPVNGCVQLEGLRVISGFSRGAFVGRPDKTVRPKFLVRWYGGGSVYCPPPEELSGARAIWGIHAYQVDTHFQDLTIDSFHARQHSFYGHNYSRWGRLRERCHSISSGGQGWKERPDNEETAWCGPDPFVIDYRCTARNWYQPWADFGGAGWVFENGSCHYYAERCEAHGGEDLPGIGANLRGRGWMFSSEPRGYDIDTGIANKTGGHGHGFVVLKQCLSAGKSAVAWQNQAIRCGPLASAMLASKHLVLDQFGGFGENRVAEIANGNRRVTVIGCNSEQIKEWCGTRGIDTRHEVRIPTAARLVPLSEGLAR